MMMTALTASLLASFWFAPPERLGPTESSVGLRFADAIPAHERARLHEVFPGKVEAACDPAPCFADCGAETETLALEVGGLTRDYELRWTTTSPDAATRVHASRCPLCSLVELEQQIADDLVRVCGELSTGDLTLSSAPDRARVRLDGRPIGRTPWTGELASGAHDLEIGAIGWVPTRTTVIIEGGQQNLVHLELERRFGSASRRPSWPAWLGVAAGVASTVAGTALLAVHGRPWTGRCSGTDIDRAGNCRFVHDTRRVGIGLTAAGLAATSVGAGLLIWIRNDESERGAGVGVRAQF